LLIKNTADYRAESKPLDLSLGEEANIVQIRGRTNTSAHWAARAKDDETVLVGLLDDLTYSHNAGDLDLESGLLPKLPSPRLSEGLERTYPAAGYDPLSAVWVLGASAKQDATFAHNDDGAAEARRSRGSHTGGLAHGEWPCPSLSPSCRRRYTERAINLRWALRNVIIPSLCPRS
jgi:hypothetical protein